MTIAIRGVSPDEVDAGVAEVAGGARPISASSRCARKLRLSPPSGRSSQATSNISRGASWFRRAISPGSRAAHNFALGQPHGNHWGEAVTLLETTAAGPYFFNFHQGDLGNFTIIGPSGSGKTVVLNFLLAQARKFDPRIVFFDKDRGGELFIRAIGGRYDVLRPGTPSGLNPLRLEDTPAIASSSIDWLALLAGHARCRGAGADQGRGRRQLSRSRRIIAACAISSNFSAAATGRTPTTSGRASVHGGATASAPGCSTMKRMTTDLAVRSVGFDMTQILDDPAVRTPAMMYLFHRVEERLDGSARDHRRR